MVMEIPGLMATFEAAASLSAKQYCVMKISASQKVNVCGDGEAGIGILQNDPELGQEASLMISGISPAVYGGTVAPNDSLASDASGRLVAAAAAKSVIAIAIEAGVGERDSSRSPHPEGTRIFPGRSAGERPLP